MTMDNLSAGRAELVIEDQFQALAFHAEIAAFIGLNNRLTVVAARADQMEKALGARVMGDITAQLKGAMEAVSHEIKLRADAIAAWDSRHEPSPAEMLRWLHNRVL